MRPETLKMKTQHIIAVVMICFWIIIAGMMFFVPIPTQNVPLINQVFVILGGITSAIGVYLFGIAVKNQETPKS
jgi:uncharacterized membrane-anchored protein